jgi:CRISPR-associated endonuclease/helicase Cas3
MLLTGIVIMADWIASNADVFPLTASGIAEERSRAGVFALDLTEPWQPHPVDPAVAEALDAHLRERFGWPENAAARPVQSIAASAAHALAGPGLMIIEAPTGEGKTEAALTAAEILAESSGAGGVIVAAPTMSTADGLFRRVLEWSKNASGDSVTSMFLAHSKSRLNPDFRSLRSTGIGRGDSEHGAEGEVIASQWMSGRKKGVLSNMSVATVDQILFLALQAKHSMLRHLGLAGKVVIIDEVHAYDTYMSQYMVTALAWLARYQVPVVLLSATLPAAQKRALLDAYRSQVSDEPIEDLSTAYPLVTTVGAGNGIQEIEMVSRPPDLHARLELIEDALPDLTGRLLEETREGGCVLLICNTVRRAQEAYRVLSENFPDEVELHHAAFLASHRATKETALREALGPSAHRGAGRPDRRIVVATQVAEQSLDIDVDLLVTDIAPVDLLIQRIGRLHRHDRPQSDRPSRMRDPQVLIRAVESTDPPVFDSGASAVYGDRLLLATLAVLMDGPLARGFERPTDIAPLVHRVYSPSPPIPDSWSEAWVTAEKKHEAKRRTAQQRSSTYRIPEPSHADKLVSLFADQQHTLDTPTGEERGLAQVRDSDPSVEVIPILVTEYGYRPLDGPADVDHSPDQEPGHHISLGLAADTVRLPGWMTRSQDMFEQVLDQLEASTPPGWRASTWLKGQVALPLDAEGGIDLAGHRLVYDPDLGLRVITGSADG